MIIDGSNTILGRLAAHAAKQALLGEKVDIVNCDKVVVSGNKYNTYAHYRQKLARGTPRKGVFITRSPDRIVKRTVRGMVPYKQAKGLEAFKRVMCYNGVPASFQGQKMETIKSAHVSKLPNLRFTSVGNIVAELRGRKHS